MPSYGKKSRTSADESSASPYRIFFIRHGETDWNRELRYQGSSDVELNEEGERQARSAGIRLSRIVPARVYSSPLKRALRTAEIILENNSGDAAVELCCDLREISFGSWEGLTAAQISERDAAALAAWREAPFSAAPDGGESFASVASRSKTAAESIKKSGRPGEAAFVVSHGAVLRALIASFMEAADIDMLWRLRFDNCSISALDRWGARPSLLLLNDTNHIRLREEDIWLLSFPD
jgi:alpha-ribazole phosphatase/probable phosphoglycerate mutase